MEKLFLLIIGVLLSTTIMAQDCPVPEGAGACIVACSDNSECTSAGQICCSNGCGYECMTPVVDPCANVGCAAPTCHESSPGIITPEGECCPVCACSATDGSMVAAGTSYMDDCNTCNCGTNGQPGCTRMACPPTTEPTASTPTTPTTATTSTTPTTPTTATTTETTLPTSSPTVMCPNVTNLSGTCDERCSSDDECSDSQLCCSNGCGHACMDAVLDCSAVSCLQPTCESPSVLVTPEGSCCPVCGCSTPNGEGAAPGETYQPDSCNTCTCTESGLAACTLAFCPPPTDTTPTTDETTVTPSVGPTDPTCPVGGQIRVGCASPCSITCANVDTVLICPTVCVTNGCQCPRDTVIDEQSNTCVPRSDCPSNYTVPTGQTCPAVQRTNEENCVNECSSNDDCRYDRICCSNGCGGRVCSDSVEMCQLIQCDWPICDDGAQPAYSPFSCCPFCPTTPSPRPSGCTASDGTSVGVGETYMDQCNSCRCLEGGVGACTRRACIGCTLADGSWVAIGDTYKKDCNTCTCTDRDVDICTEIACNVVSPGCTLADGSWVAIGDTYKKDCNTCTCTDRDVDICTEIACNVVNPGDQDTLDGGGATMFAGLITTLLCGLLSVFF